MALLLLFWGCQQDDPVTELAENMNGLTVQQAQEWFLANQTDRPSAAANKKTKEKPYVFTPD